MTSPLNNSFIGLLESLSCMGKNTYTPTLEIKESFFYTLNNYILNDIDINLNDIEKYFTINLI